MPRTGRNYLFKSECDTYSASSIEEAVRLRDKDTGLSSDESSDDPFDPEPVPDDKIIEVGLEEISPEFKWVQGEPDASLIKQHEKQCHPWLLKAPACIWAKHTTGIVCSTEF